MRTVADCAAWSAKADPSAKHFFFREEGNYHCSPCPLSYKGHATQGTGYQNSKIYTYDINCGNDDDDGEWKKVADENGNATCSGKCRFGKEPKWIVKDVNGSIKCSSAAFGRDPYPG